LICGECGFDLGAPDALANWEGQVWEALVRPDRAYFETTDPKGLEFPSSIQTRRVALVGEQVSIGRRSSSKGIAPDIDLSGSHEDIGVSHRHALLLRKPDGSWSLVDQGSTNGTFLNDEREPVPPNEPVSINDGDRIHLGAWTTLTVERLSVGDGQPVEVEAVPSKDTRAMSRSGPAAVEVGLLGPLTVRASGSDVLISAPKARAVLAALALKIGAEVPAGELEEALWGDEEPKTASKALQGYISGLRRQLPAEAIETTPRGYRLVGPRRALDVFRFEQQCRRGRELLVDGHAGLAAAEIGRALELWRGAPLPDLTAGPLGVTEAARLLERRAGAEEDLFEARLRLGDHQGVVPDLQAAVAAEPLRERRWAQLMLALHRSGRQVEALRAFQHLRQKLGEEHGVEPSVELLALERAIVLDSPDLQWTPEGQLSEAGAAISAR
jgi:DNA-binding SARP family transcriptional activator